MKALSISLAALVLFTLTACDAALPVGDGCDDDSSPAVGDGTPAPSPTTAASYRWVDRDGTPVTDSTELVLEDGDGLQWTIDPDTGQPDVEPAAYYYAFADCAGQPLVESRLPREPIDTIDGWRTRGDEQQSYYVCVWSRLDIHSDCEPIDKRCDRFLRVDQLTAVSGDGGSVAFEAPLRREIIDSVGY
jgi:hypothetical protein